MAVHRMLLALLPLAHAFSAHRGSCRFFLDTADVNEYKSLLPLGIFHGVTTNPTILQRSGVPCTVSAIKGLCSTAFQLGADEFMCQAWGGSADRLFETGMQLREIDREKVVVKVPVTAAGTEAAARLMKQPGGTRICLTACYASTQALVAGSVGAEYLAPYLGRMSDAGKDGADECERMQQIVEGLDCDTRILVASIRDVDSMAELACAGLDTYTFSPDVARALFTEELTASAAAAFEEAAAASST